MKTLFELQNEIKQFTESFSKQFTEYYAIQFNSTYLEAWDGTCQLNMQLQLSEPAVENDSLLTAFNNQYITDITNIISDKLIAQPLNITNLEEQGYPIFQPIILISTEGYIINITQGDATYYISVNLNRL